MTWNEPLLLLELVMNDSVSGLPAREVWKNSSDWSIAVGPNNHQCNIKSQCVHVNELTIVYIDYESMTNQLGSQRFCGMISNGSVTLNTVSKSTLDVQHRPRFEEWARTHRVKVKKQNGLGGCLVTFGCFWNLNFRFGETDCFGCFGAPCQWRAPVASHCYIVLVQHLEAKVAMPYHPETVPPKQEAQTKPWSTDRLIVKQCPGASRQTPGACDKQNLETR